MTACACAVSALRMKIIQSAILLNAVVTTGAGANVMELRSGEDSLTVHLKTAGTVALTVDLEVENPAIPGDWAKVGTSGSLTTVGNTAFTVSNVVAQRARLNVSARTNGTVTGTIVAGRFGCN